jgi:putative transposase
MAHVKWECKYHIVFIPKCRKKVLYDKLRKRVGEILQQLCKHKGLELLEGHAMPDHVHMCLSIPPKYSVSMFIGYIKGKSAIRVHREFMGCKKQFTGFHFWATGYCVSTIGLDEQQIRNYVRNQEQIERGKIGQLKLPDFEKPWPLYFNGLVGL